jgi:HlyD family secretion protein
VDVGQTVAASLQAPVLFLIANDLTRMQVLADIDEADVGQLGADSKVTFTVDAFPADTFTGRISQIRLAPQAMQNVVTYTAVIDVPNPELKLRPGMTANVTATVAERNDVLVVPASALRFRPEGATEAQPRRRAGATLWKVEGEHLTPVSVRPGLSDGSVVEIAGGEIKEGDRIAVPVQQQQQAPAPGNSMLMRAPRGGRK